MKNTYGKNIRTVVRCFKNIADIYYKTQITYLCCVSDDEHNQTKIANFLDTKQILNNIDKA